MDSNKSWLWKRKSSEKALDTDEILRKYLKDSHFEDLKPGKDLVPSICKLGPSECDCNAKDDLVSIHSKMAEEAIAAKEIAEAQVLALAQELGVASDLRVAAEERLAQVEEKVEEALGNKVRAYEGKQRFLEEKFVGACRRADALATENAKMRDDLRQKEKLVEDFEKRKSESEGEFGVLMARVDSTEKENSFLRYEFRMLEKELEIRSVEREFSRALAEDLQQQQLESVKKIAKLESECLRLNALLRKKLQRPVALCKMKSEIEMLRRDQNDMRSRRKSGNGILESSNEIHGKKAAILVDRLCGLEEEIKCLQTLLSQKDSELQDHRIMISRLSTKLSEAEAQLSNISQSEKDSMEPVKFSPLSNNLSLDPGTEDKTSDSGSWSNGLSADHEKLKLNKMLGVSDMNLMDDFVEMEKLAMVSADLSAKFTGKELVPVSLDEFKASETLSSADASSGRFHDWLQDVLKAITEEHLVSKRSIPDLLADINIVLGNSKQVAEETFVPRSPNRINSSALMNSAAHHDEIKKPPAQQTPSALVENSGAKLELQGIERAKRSLDAKLNSVRSDDATSNSLVTQLREYEQIIEQLRFELETTKYSKGISEDQVEIQNSANEDLATQLAVANGKLNELVQKYSWLEMELETKSSSWEHLEATCLDLELQLHSSDMKKIAGEMKKSSSSPTGLELTTTSVNKPLNSGREEAEIMIKALSISLENKSQNKRFSLRDQLLADNAGTKTEGQKQAPALQVVPYLSPRNKSGNLAIVPSRRKSGGSGGLLRRLLMRKKKRNISGQTSLTFGIV